VTVKCDELSEPIMIYVLYVKCANPYYSLESWSKMSKYAVSSNSVSVWA